MCTYIYILIIHRPPECFLEIYGCTYPFRQLTPASMAITDTLRSHCYLPDGIEQLLLIGVIHQLRKLIRRGVDFLEAESHESCSGELSEIWTGYVSSWSTRH